MKTRFIAKKLNFIHQSSIEDGGDFLIQAHCEVTQEGQAGGEAFIIYLVSPSRIASEGIASREKVLWVRNYFIVESPDEAIVLPIIQNALDKVEAKDWQELIQSTKIVFDWI
jgi:hypothetical protein